MNKEKTELIYLWIEQNIPRIFFKEHLKEVYNIQTLLFLM